VFYALSNGCEFLSFMLQLAFSRGLVLWIGRGFGRSYRNGLGDWGQVPVPYTQSLTFGAVVVFTAVINFTIFVSLLQYCIYSKNIHQN